MVEILFLLLPIAFFSGWRAASKKLKSSQKKKVNFPTTLSKGLITF